MTKFLNTSRLNKNTLANDLGFRRVDAVFSTIDVTNIESPSLPSKTVQAQLPSTWNGELNVAVTVQQVGTESPLIIPAGSTIDSFKVVGLQQLDPNLSLTLGYFDPALKNEAAQVYSLSRVVSIKAPLTGAVLNAHQSVTFNDRLYHQQADKLASYTSADPNGDAQKAFYASLGDHDYVGEPRSLMPAVGVLSGSVKAQDLLFVITYTPPTAA